jgi:uncharacterized membrane protein YphA (DoxX/SURF4 family)
MRIVKIIGVWTLQIGVGLLFVLLGVMKFQDPSWARNFERWGYPDGFYMVVGVLEAAGGAVLLVPRLATYAALLLIAVMVGAAGTHLVFGELQRLPVPLVYLLLIALVGWLRRRSALRLRAGSAEPQAVV